MSQQPISRSPDLQRLRDEGYNVAVEEGYLVVRDVPYADSRRRVKRGTLYSPLSLAGDRTVPPSDHTAWFVGGQPCTADGVPIRQMIRFADRRDFGDGVITAYALCSLSVEGEFPDYHAKMTTFVAQIASHAEAVDPSASARTGRVVVAAGNRSTFAYVDTASSRHGIGAFNARLAGLSVGIVGLGGTGSYILDLIAKTPVGRIHLFDDDDFDQHNAFRSPGAPSLAELQERPTKVARFERIYSKMHNGIVGHEVRLGPSNLYLLTHLDFVFLAVDVAVTRRILISQMERLGTTFIDCGLGMHISERGLVGTLRVTTSTASMRAHVQASDRIPMVGVEDDPYSTNVQVADLNMLAAALAVGRWKRHYGVYLDLEREHHSVYQLDGNTLVNEDRLGPGGRS